MLRCFPFCPSTTQHFLHLSDTISRMRRRVGVGKHLHKRKQNEQYANKGSELSEQVLSHMQEQLSVFKAKLETFAKQHKKEIKEDPLFRTQFQEMCTQAGVDPLASNKGYWGELLGVGDFYYELAVQCIDICGREREKNGGLMSLHELLGLAIQKRGSTVQSICANDIVQAIKHVSVLGNGFQIIRPRHGQLMVLSVPVELNQDHTSLIEYAQAHQGKITVDALLADTATDKWSPVRAQRALDMLLEEGMAWVDSQRPDGVNEYWLPSVFFSSKEG
jgi:ESCRT-II complex subunit VPS22